MRTVSGFNFGTGAPPNVITNGLVLWLDAANRISYPESGVTWGDLTVQRNNGTLQNGVGYTASNGGAMTFDGTDDRITITDSDSIDLPADFTIESWFYPVTTGASARGIINHRVSSGASAGTWALGVINSQVVWQKQETPVVTNSWGTVTNNTWHHVVITRSGSTIKGYLNGVEGMSITQTTNFTNTNLCVIGMWGTNTAGWTGTPTGPFQGRISLARIYKGKSFTAEEVNINFTAMRGRYGI